MFLKIPTARGSQPSSAGVGCVQSTGIGMAVANRAWTSLSTRWRKRAPLGRAPDGVIEAIEDPAAKFCLGVQWHPENFFRTGEFRALFEGFLEAAQKA
jgi:CTP synthase (UTP-ammonia lyase)